MIKHESINYLEFASQDLTETKSFFKAVFGWSFTDYGPEYTAFSLDQLDGGFYAAKQVKTADAGAPLTVFYSADIAETRQKIRNAGGRITRDIFEFPGGRRFHFKEPGGNEMAVWSE
ncbi:MAG: VOC family protein [Proteobacteria bacterium]|nr:MAG: VOC family protein [Pseudomonadota bacterium]